MLELSLFVTSFKLVGLAFAIEYARAAWKQRGLPYPSTKAWLRLAMDVTLIGIFCNTFDYVIFADGGMELAWLGGMTLGMLRALCDLVPLWSVGIFVYLCLWLDARKPMRERRMGALVFASAFCLLTIPQAFGLMDKIIDGLSSALGRLVPVGLLAILWLIKPSDEKRLGSPMDIARMACSLALVTLVLVRWIF